MEKLSGYEPGIRRSNRLRNIYIPLDKWKRHEISNLTFAGPNPAGDICRYGEIGYHASLIRRYFLFELGYLYCDRRTNTTWDALENYAGAENALVVVDGSGSMYSGGNPSPAAVAQSLGIYFAERNTGAFHNHFITFSNSPRLVEIKGRDIVEKVRYCMSFNECSNTDIEKTFMLILRTVVVNKLTQKDMPEIIYIISDMEFDWCAGNSSMTNFENAKKIFEESGYRLPKIVFWNVNSRNVQQSVKMNEQGVVLVLGNSPQIFSMIKENNLDPYNFMMSVLSSQRYERIAG